jgi:hypothetical protein
MGRGCRCADVIESPLSGCEFNRSMQTVKIKLLKFRISITFRSLHVSLGT